MAPFGGPATTRNFVRQCGGGCFWKGVDGGGVRVEGRGERGKVEFIRFEGEGWMVVVRM